jgi:hypothetical protein
MSFSDLKNYLKISSHFAMNTATTASPNRVRFNEKNADRFGVAASVLCAVHCALAPVLLILLPTFGKIWAHPASHALVAIFIVPLAAFTLLKGYRKHGKRWIAVSAMAGIFLVLFGAALPAFAKTDDSFAELASDPEPAAIEACEASSDGSGEDSCGECASEDAGEIADTETCVDDCCPSIQVSESGETSLHVPPAAIITTFGGLFLIGAHFGNLRSGAGACLVDDCSSCDDSEEAS